MSETEVRALADALRPYLYPTPSAPVEEPPYVTIPEAAEILRCGRQRVDNLLSAGKLTRLKDGRRTLIERTELVDYLAGMPTGRGRERLRRAAPLRPQHRNAA